MRRALVLMLPLLLLVGASAAMLIRTGSQTGTHPARPLVLGPAQTVHDVLVVGRSLDLRGTVRESVLVVDGDLTLLPSARVEGDVAVLGGRLTLDPGSRVQGTVVQIGGRIGWLSLQTGLWLLVVYKAVLALATVLGALLLTALVPRHLATLTQTARAAPVRSLIAGVVGYVLAALTAVLLAVTLIGLPLALALLLATFVAGLTGVAGAALLLERWLARAGPDQVVHPHRSLALLALLSLVPLVGEAVLALLGVLGLGALLVALAQARRTAALRS